MAKPRGCLGLFKLPHFEIGNSCKYSRSDVFKGGGGEDRGAPDVDRELSEKNR